MPNNRITAKKKCPICHNFTAKGHSSTLYDADNANDANACLDLAIDPLRLGRTQQDGCRQCNVLCKALDGFVGKNWRCQRAAIQVDIVEKSAIKVTVPKKGGDPLVFELYSSQSKLAVMIRNCDSSYFFCSYAFVISPSRKYLRVSWHNAYKRLVA
jgi:hypothetical protein